MTDDKPDWRNRFERSLDELKTFGAQVGRELEQGTAGARREAAEAFQRIKPKLGEAETKLREATEDAVEQLEEMFGELRKSLRSLRDKL